VFRTLAAYTLRMTDAAAINEMRAPMLSSICSRLGGECRLASAIVPDSPVSVCAVVHMVN
jgi:hypothetical protein